MDRICLPAGLMTGPKNLMITSLTFRPLILFLFMFRQQIGIVSRHADRGGGVGFFFSLNIPRLIDGGAVSSPNRAIYNHLKGCLGRREPRVAPDVEVELSD